MEENALGKLLGANIANYGAEQLDWWARGAKPEDLVQIAKAKRLGKGTKAYLLQRPEIWVNCAVALRADIPDSDKSLVLAKALDILQEEVENGGETGLLVSMTTEVMNRIKDKELVKTTCSGDGLNLLLILSSEGPRLLDSETFAEAVNWACRRQNSGKAIANTSALLRSIEGIKSRDKADTVEIAKTVVAYLPAIMGSSRGKVSENLRTWEELWNRVVECCTEGRDRSMLVQFASAQAGIGKPLRGENLKEIENWVLEEEKNGRMSASELLALLANWDETSSAGDLIEVFSNMSRAGVTATQAWSVLLEAGLSPAWAASRGYTVADSTSSKRAMLATWTGAFFERNEEIRAEIENQIEQGVVVKAADIVEALSDEARYVADDAKTANLISWLAPLWAKAAAMDEGAHLPVLRRGHIVRLLLEGKQATSDPGNVLMPLLPLAGGPTPTGKWVAVELAKLGKTEGAAVYLAANSYVGTFPGTARELVETVRESIKAASGKESKAGGPKDRKTPGGRKKPAVNGPATSPRAQS